MTSLSIEIGLRLEEERLEGEVRENCEGRQTLRQKTDRLSETEMGAGLCCQGCP